MGATFQVSTKIGISSSWKAVDTDKVVEHPDPAQTYISQSTKGERIDVHALGKLNAIGGQGNDTLIGDSGNNWLEGGAGSDTFDAGAGDDTLVIDAQDKQENINGGDGFDRVIVSGSEGGSFI